MLKSLKVAIKNTEKMNRDWSIGTRPKYVYENHYTFTHISGKIFFLYKVYLYYYLKLLLLHYHYLFYHCIISIIFQLLSLQYIVIDYYNYLLLIINILPLII